MECPSSIKLVNLVHRLESILCFISKPPEEDGG